MASILKRGSRFRVLIRKKDSPPICKTFSDRRSAETYAKLVESEIERGIFLDTGQADRTSFLDLVNRYEKEILPSKKSHLTECYSLRPLKKSLGGYNLAQIQPFIVSQHRDKRLKEVKPATVKRELRLLSRILSASEKEFGIYLPHGNPVSKIRLPKEPEGRSRRISPEEYECLKEVMKKNQIMLHSIILAIETGMRRGELSRIRCGDIDQNSSTLFIPETKTGLSRTIPLSKQARESIKVLIEVQEEIRPDGRIIPVQPHSITKAFERACERANIEDLRFHDLRHEATSRFFEKGLNSMEVASITGHQDLKMLRRYTHIRAETLVDRL